MKIKKVEALILATMILLMLFSPLYASPPEPPQDIHYSFPPDLRGDVDCDGYVGTSDIFMVASAFGGTFYDDRWNPLCDVDDDGFVGISDLFSVASLFGTEYSTYPTPVAYSTSFEFNVPNSGSPQVWVSY